MISSLLKNNLKRLLIKTYPQGFTDMLARVERYAHMQDAFMQEKVPPVPHWGVMRMYKRFEAFFKVGRSPVALQVLASKEEKQDSLRLPTQESSQRRLPGIPIEEIQHLHPTKYTKGESSDRNQRANPRGPEAAVLSSKKKSKQVMCVLLQPWPWHRRVYLALR